MPSAQLRIHARHRDDAFPTGYEASMKDSMPELVRRAEARYVQMLSGRPKLRFIALSASCGGRRQLAAVR